MLSVFKTDQPTNPPNRPNRAAREEASGSGEERKLQSKEREEYALDNNMKFIKLRD